MALTQKELDYLREKYGCSFEVVEHPPKTFNYKAEFQLLENSHPTLRDAEIVIKDAGENIEVSIAAAVGEMEGKYGVRYAILKDAPISKLFKAIKLSYDDILEIAKRN